MKILALETSAKSVSAAVAENGVILAAAYQNTGLTHSRTLMPLVDGMLRAASLTLDDMGLIAVAHGPGSFTGLRIGVSAAKGLAWAKSLPCCGVSTLEAMARGVSDFDGLIVCAMDARRSQVYNAIFEIKDVRPVRLTEDRPIALAELAGEVRALGAPVFLVGDGTALTKKELLARGMNQSAIHEDVMVGAEDSHITGKCRDGRTVELFKDGVWVL